MQNRLTRCALILGSAVLGAGCHEGTGTSSSDVESVGTFHFENEAIVLELRPKGEYSPSAWSVHGSLDGGRLTLGYPGPADGWVNEEYRRK